MTKVYAASDVGIRWAALPNADSYRVKYFPTSQGRFVVAALADGHSITKSDFNYPARFASRAAIKYAMQIIEPVVSLGKNSAILRNAIETGFEYANKRLFERFGILHDQAETTLDVLVLSPSGEYIIGHIGDARIYSVQGSNSQNIKQITQDQVEYDNVSAEELKNMGWLFHRRRQFTPESIGRSVMPRLEINHGHIEGGVLVMVSDGVYSSVHPKEIAGLAYDSKDPAKLIVDKAKNPDGVIAAVASYAESKGLKFVEEEWRSGLAGHDNATAIVVRRGTSNGW